MRIGNQRRRTSGFAYVLLLLAVALIAIVATSAISLGAMMARRDAERELLAIGAEFQQALRSYAGVPMGTPVPGAGLGPRSLEELLKDPRVPGIRRHLRRVHADPLTGRNEWGLVLDPHGQIIGVHSLANGKPIQRAGFASRFPAFENADSYRQWVFAGVRVAP